jgi:hypothetical protein
MYNLFRNLASDLYVFICMFVPLAFKATDVCPSSWNQMLKELLCGHNWVVVYEMSRFDMHMQK